MSQRLDRCLARSPVVHGNGHGAAACPKWGSDPMVAKPCPGEAQRRESPLAIDFGRRTDNGR